MILQAAFIFIAPEADPAKHRSIVKTSAVHLTVVGVKNYDEAEKVAKELVNQGITSLELCGGFGSMGTAAVSKAVEHKASVGAVRFDIHPGLNFKSGDEFFSQYPK
jgi:predicted Rossmann-fold nucleotide-binding protein